MANILLNYLYPGSVPSAYRLLRFGARWLDSAISGTSYLTDDNEGTALTISYDGDHTSGNRVTFNISAAYKWFPRYLSLLYNINSGSISSITATLYKGSTSWGTFSFSLQAGTNRFVTQISPTADFSYTDGTDFKLIWDKDVTTPGQTLSIYQMELGELRHTAPLFMDVDGAGDIQYFSSYAVEDSSSDAMFPVRVKKETSGTDSLALFTVPSTYPTSLYDDQCYNTLLLQASLAGQQTELGEIGSKTLKFVPPFNCFFNGECESTYAPALNSATTTYASLSVANFTVARSDAQKFKGTYAFSGSYTDAATVYLGTSGTTSMQILTCIPTTHDMIMYFRCAMRNSDVLTAISFEAYYEAAWHTLETASIVNTLTDTWEVLESSFTVPLNTKTVTGFRVKITSPATTGDVYLDELFLGVIGYAN